MKNIIMFDAAFPPPVIGGKEKQALLLSTELVREKWNVLALTHDKYIKNEITEINGIQIIRFKFINYPIAIIKIFFILAYLRSSFRIIHIHNPSYIGKATVLVSKILRYKTVFKIPSDKIVIKINWLDKLIYKSVDYVVALNNFTAGRLKNIKCNYQKFHNGVIPYKRNNYSESVNRYNILIVARLVPQKDILTAMNVILLLTKSSIGKNVRLYLVGDGSERSIIENFIKEHNLCQYVVIEGHSDNPGNFYQQADLFLSTSIHEGMSNTILEAMSYGVPVLATKVGAAEVQLGDKYSFLLQNVKDVEGIYNAAFKILSDYNVKCGISEYLHDRAVNIFAIDKIATEYIQLYNKLLNE